MRTPDLGDHEQDRVVLPGRRPRLVHGHLVTADLDHLVTGDDPVSIRLDGLGQHGVSTDSAYPANVLVTFGSRGEAPPDDTMVMHHFGAGFSASSRFGEDYGSARGQKPYC